MPEKRYDVLIIGAGPNGLTIGAYLSRCGLKVLLLERRHEAGGGLATEEVTLPGFLHNTHAVYMLMVDYAPIYADLQLEQRYGLKHLFPPLQFALPLSDGRCVCLYSDVEKTCRSLAAFSRHDAEAYQALAGVVRKHMDEFLAAATYLPPLPVLDQVVALQQTPTGREIAALSEKSPRDLVYEHFENEHVRALMLYAATHWGVPYDQPGLGYLAALYLDRALNYRLVKGGSHCTAQALHKVIFENNGLILTNQRIARIIIEAGRATGLEMEDGSVIRADKAVVSTVDPHQTFLKLVGEENLQKEFSEKIKGWQWEKYSLLGIHLALEIPPVFTAATSNPDLNRALVYILGFETATDLVNEYDAVSRGELRPQARISACFPSIHDAGQAPPGKCSGILSRFAPYDLRQGKEEWYNIRFKEELAENCLAALHCYAPNITAREVMWKYVSTPLDVENKFQNMVKGGYKQGHYHPLQMGYLRPNEGCSRNRTPIKNLYLGGASCHPGGGVTWGAGYLAANAIAEDLRLQKWWPTPKIVMRAREKGLCV